MATFTPAALNARSATLSIPSNASGSPHGVALSGNGVAAPAPAVTLSPASVAFGNQTVGGSIAKPITLTNSGSAALGITSIVASGSGFTSVQHLRRDAGGRGQLHDQCHLYADGRRRVHRRRDSHIGCNWKPPYGRPLRYRHCSHTVGAGCHSGAGRRRLRLGDANTPSTTRAVSLSNTGDAPLKLSAVNLGGANASEFHDTQHPGGRCPGGRGELLDQRQVHARGDGHPCCDLDADVRRSRLARGRPEGGQALVQASARRRSHRARRTSSACALARRAMNARSASATPARRRFSSARQRHGTIVYESDCKATLAAGKSCEMNVKFKPSAVGARTGELSVGSNAGRRASRRQVERYRRHSRQP